MININSLLAFQHHWKLLSLIISRTFLISFWLINRKKILNFTFFFAKKLCTFFGKWNTRGNLRWFFCVVRFLESTNVFSKLAKFSRILCEIITQYRFRWDLELQSLILKIHDQQKAGTFEIHDQQKLERLKYMTSESWNVWNTWPAKAGTFEIHDQQKLEHLKYMTSKSWSFWKYMTNESWIFWKYMDQRDAGSFGNTSDLTQNLNFVKGKNLIRTLNLEGYRCEDRILKRAKFSKRIEESRILGEN